MVQAVKSIALKAAQIASIPASSLRQFPPKEVVYNAGAGAPVFNAEAWSNLQQPPVSALTAFAHRIGLANVIQKPQEILQACTHRTYPQFYATHHPNDPPLQSNSNLASLGNSLLGLFATEYVHASYPHLPTRAMKAAISAYVGPLSCSNIAKEMGATPLLRWHRTEVIPTMPVPVTLEGALSTIPRALTALVYQNRSLPHARKFVHAFFLSREVDLRPLLKFSDPKTALARTVSKFERERPISRILKETGRRTNSPIFVVGVYSGVDKLGEGFGSSLKMAEFRAAEDALHRLYLTRTPPHLLTLPSHIFPEGRGSVFKLTKQGEEYVAGEIGVTEVVYASKDR
ncbi:ribonuclease III [Rickenella mellea]|uniref:Large ribosomal subunit protein mL44 n=1 Tax=Rickenella mellea TaxID=50990 RepID=A0A4Y7Q8Z9_9AGAM|nr:ribonuclease III [Rickenella mellea]